MASAATAGKQAASAEMAHLLSQQKQIRGWLSDVDQKIYSLETSYLVETSMGNVVKGWDIDAKPVVGRSRLIEDRERLFSQSSYKTWLGNKMAAEGEEKRRADAAPAGAPKTKKMRKSKSTARIGDDAWEPDF